MGDKLPHELLIITRRKAKLRNAFSNITAVDIKLSKARISKVTQSSSF